MSILVFSLADTTGPGSNPLCKFEAPGLAIGLASIMIGFCNPMGEKIKSSPAAERDKIKTIAMMLRSGFVTGGT